MKKRKKVPAKAAETMVGTTAEQKLGQKAGQKASQKAEAATMLLPAIVLGIALIAFLNPWIKYQYWQSDTFWLIETGRLILQQHALPTHDPYSYTSSAPHWFIYQWLTEVIFALFDKVGGLAGLALFGGLVFAALFCILIFRSQLRDGVNSVIAAATIFFCSYAFYPAFSSLRPQLFSYVLFWLTYELCLKVRSGLPLRKAMLWTFVIAVIWANCHISFLAGLVLLVGYLIGSLLGKPSERNLCLRFAALIVTFWLGTFINPYAGWLWTFVGDVHNLFYTQEVSPLNWAGEPHRLAVAIVTCISAVYLWWRKKYDVGSTIVLIMLLAIGSNCSRLFTYFCLFACLTVGKAVSEALQPYLMNEAINRFSEAIKTLALSGRYIGAVMIVMAALVLCQPVVLQPNVPVQAAKYLATNPVKGHLFCTAHAGSYLIYSSHGSIPVFMDTRVDLYDPDLCFRFIKVVYSAENWKELFAQYKIAAALVPNNVKIREVLGGEPDWKVVYNDQDFTLFVKNTAP
jgi:hypothetical protein